MAGEPESRSHSRSRRGTNWTVLAAMLVSACVPRVVHAQDQPVSGDQTASAQSVDSDVVTAQTDAEKRSELRQQSALAGLLVLALLCVVFVTLMICVVLWARRMRRLTNQPLPDQHPGDPLWYLRKPVAKADDGGSDD
jgi:cobalamin biosynthesis Mg chelatase CobN